VVQYGGLSLAPTRHRLEVGGRSLCTWCAWDTLFIPELLNTTALVESTCPATGERVALTVHPDGMVPTRQSPFVSFVKPEPTKATADIVKHFCCHVQFFASELAGREWISQHPGTLIATLDQAWQLGRRRNAQRYPMMQA
jgi:alkylmercury lyase